MRRNSGSKSPRIAVIGAGLAGSICALRLARTGVDVDLIDSLDTPVRGASLHNEGKLHLGYVYAADPDARTHSVLIEGSLKFIDIVESMTATRFDKDLYSRPFDYGIHAESAFSVEHCLAHAATVDDALRHALPRSGSLHPGRPFWPSERLSSRTLANRYGSDIVAAYSTQEISINTRTVALAVRRAVAREPLIRFLGKNTVKTVEKTSHGGFRIELPQSKRVPIYDYVVNASWESRRLLDKQIGMTSKTEQILRYKAAITLKTPSKITAKLPSTTFVLGPFGDVVRLGDGSVYLSWYPACKIAQSLSDDPAPLKRAAHQTAGIISASATALAALSPALDSIKPYLAQARLGGGIIAAHGSTDIDSPTSQLHQRHSVGVRQLENWLSINTGKYCTAPLFGLSAAQNVEALL